MLSLLFDSFSSIDKYQTLKQGTSRFLNSKDMANWVKFMILGKHAIDYSNFKWSLSYIYNTVKVWIRMIMDLIHVTVIQWVEFIEMGLPMPKNWKWLSPSLLWLLTPKREAIIIITVHEYHHLRSFKSLRTKLTLAREYQPEAQFIFLPEPIRACIWAKWYSRAANYCPQIGFKSIA